MITKNNNNPGAYWEHGIWRFSKNKTFYFHTKKTPLYCILLSLGPRVHFRGKKLIFGKTRLKILPVLTREHYTKVRVFIVGKKKVNIPHIFEKNEIEKSHQSHACPWVMSTFRR
jgi:hypothetical protein